MTNGCNLEKGELESICAFLSADLGKNAQRSRSQQKRETNENLDAFGGINGRFMLVNDGTKLYEQRQPTETYKDQPNMNMNSMQLLQADAQTPTKSNVHAGARMA